MTDPRNAGLAEEALRLVETLQLLAGAHAAGHANDRERVDGAGADRPRSGPAGAAASPECQVCPVCRLIAVLRNLRPEVLEHLVAAGEELLAAVRELAASSSSTADPFGASAKAGREGGAGRSSSTAPRRPERIELD